MSHARLGVWPSLAGAKIAPELYGHQMEMVGRSVYDGIWAGRASRDSNEDGIRLDVLALLKHLRVPMLKWPGDAFADFYHWRDGVGSGKARTQRVNIPWQQMEPNTFGLHEFMNLCQKLGCAPWVTCNGHTGTLDEALAWVEYATFGGETERTQERCHNGSPDPFEIPYWSASRGGQWGMESLATLNPDIKAIDAFDAQPGPKNAENTPKTDAKAGLLSIRHFFTHGPGRDFGRDDYEAMCVGLCDFECDLRRCIAQLACQYGENRPAIALRAWGVWHPEATAENGLEQPNTLRDALLAASVYNLLNQHAAHVKMAALAQAVNALQCLAVTEGAKMYLTPTYHVADMMRPHRGARLLTHRLKTPDFEVASSSGAAPVTIPTLSVSASRAGKRVCITAVNRSYTEALPLSVEIHEAGIASLSGRLLHADAVSTENSFDRPKNVTPKRLKLTPDGNTFHDTLPPHSFAAYTVTLGQG